MTIHTFHHCLVRAQPSAGAGICLAGLFTLSGRPVVSQLVCFTVSGWPVISQLVCLGGLLLASSGQVEGSGLELAELSKLVRSNSRLHTPTSEKKIVSAFCHTDLDFFVYSKCV